MTAFSTCGHGDQTRRDGLERERCSREPGLVPRSGSSAQLNNWRGITGVALHSEAAAKGIDRNSLDLCDVFYDSLNRTVP